MLYSRTHIASGPARNRGWLRAIFDPQIGTALGAIHGNVTTSWTVESMNRSLRRQECPAPDSQRDLRNYSARHHWNI